MKKEVMVPVGREWPLLVEAHRASWLDTSCLNLEITTANLEAIIRSVPDPHDIGASSTNADRSNTKRLNIGHASHMEKVLESKIGASLFGN